MRLLIYFNTAISVIIVVSALSFGIYKFVEYRHGIAFEKEYNTAIEEQNKIIKEELLDRFLGYSDVYICIPKDLSVKEQVKITLVTEYEIVHVIKTSSNLKIGDRFYVINMIDSLYNSEILYFWGRYKPDFAPEFVFVDEKDLKLVKENDEIKKYFLDYFSIPSSDPDGYYGRLFFDILDETGWSRESYLEGFLSKNSSDKDVD